MFSLNICIMVLYLSHSTIGESSDRKGKSVYRPIPPMEINLPYSDLSIATSPFFNYRYHNLYNPSANPYQQQISPRIFWGNLFGNDPNRVVKMNDLADINNKLAQSQKDINGINSRITSLHAKACPAGTTQVGSECFMLVKDTTSWAAAKDACYIKGGFIAIPKTGDTTFLAKMAPGTDVFWVGAQETGAATNLFNWIDGATAPVPAAAAAIATQECLTGKGEAAGITLARGVDCAAATTVKQFLCEFQIS